MRLDKRFIGEEFTIPKRKFVALPTNLLGKNNDISKDIYDLIDRTYKPIGGHIDFKKQTDLPSDFTFWIGADVDKDPDVDAVRFGKRGPGGLKLAGSGTDGSDAAKQVMINKTAKMLNTKGNYVEASGGMAHVMIKYKKVPFVSDIEDIKKMLPGKDVKYIGEHPNGKYPGYDGWYERTLGGKKHMKIILGKPNGVGNQHA
jgi:hypothetical protein